MAPLPKIKKKKLNLFSSNNQKKIAIFFVLIMNLLLCSGFGFLIYTKAQNSSRYQQFDVGLDSEAYVYTDPDGVPRIKAKTISDLMFVQGYVEGKDRLLQCDLLRKLASGKLASILGNDYIESDLFIHSIGIPEIASESIAQTKSEVLGYCQRYLDGLNFYIQQHTQNLPFEYDLLKLMGLPLTYVPEFFTIEDILSVLLYFSFEFNSNYGFNIGLENFIENIGVEAFNDFARYLKINGEYNITEDDLIIPRGGLFSINPNTIRKSHCQIASANIFGNLKGSNSWVISGGRTLSGMPILANDPHMVIGNPGIMKSWHMVAIEQNLTLIGAQLPLIPGIILGRNDRLSWGITAPFFDCGDAWKITLNPEGTHYLYNGTYCPIDKKDVKIYSNDGLWKQYTIDKIPGHGVLLNISNEILAFRWSAMIDTNPDCLGSTMLNALFDLILSRDEEDILELSDPVNGWDDLPLNVLYATKTNSIFSF